MKGVRVEVPSRAVGPGRREIDELGSASEYGAVTLFLAISVMGLFVLAGLVVDGAAKVRAVQRADRVAAEAARTGGQSLDVAAVLQGGHVVVDRRLAVRAATAYLEAAGMSGSVSVTEVGAGLAVETSTSVPTVFLGLVGIQQFTVRGHAEVTLVHPGTGARP